MRAAVNFNDEPNLRTIEIDDEVTNAVLPSELERRQFSQSAPELLLGKRLSASQPTREFVIAISRLVPHAFEDTSE